MSEIILPIKCSTIKRTHSFLERVLLIELAIAAVIGTVAFSLFVYYGLFYFYIVHLNPDVYAPWMFSLVAPVGFFLSFGDSLPEITCIKDEADNEHPRQAP